MKVLDSDFLVALLRKDDEVKKKLDEISASEELIATTVFNAHEILYGALVGSNRQNYPAAMQLINSMKILDYTTKCAENALKVILYLSGKGKSIGLFDEMIAGICIANNAVIVTRNAKHFSRVPMLNVEKW